MIKDKDIRLKYLLENKEFFNQGIFINEYDINGKNRVDFALFRDGYFIGYEIKSEADNLKRFIPQLKTYLKFFDYIYLIVHHKHFEEVCSVLKRYKLNKVGIVSVKDDLSFEMSREALINDKINKLYSKVRNLKQEDLLDLCKSKNLKINNLLKETLINQLIGKITLEEVSSKLTQRLKDTYVHKCPKCRSNLTFRTITKNIKETIDKKINVLENKCKITCFEVIITSKIIKCIECSHEFKHSENRVSSKKIKYIKEYKL